MNLEYFKTLQNPQSGSHCFTSKDSKACPGAMHALQARLKHLENEKTHFKDNQIIFESRCYNDREKWQTRFLQEINLNKQQESLFINQLHKQQEQIQQLQVRTLSLQEQLKTKETQTNNSQNSSIHLKNQFKADIQSLHLQIELLQKSLNIKSSETKSTSTQSYKLIQEKNLLSQELKQQKIIRSNLESELKFSIENLEYQQNLQSLEFEFIKSSSELSNKIKELEINNRSLREISTNQYKKIQYLRRQIVELSEFNFINEEEFMDQRDLKNRNESNRKVRPKSVPRSFNRFKSQKENLDKGKIICGLGERGCEDEVRRMIGESGKNLDMLNQRYKTLIGLSYKENSDLASVRRDLMRISDEIELNNEELYDLKKKQQEFLRAKLVGYD